MPPNKPGLPASPFVVPAFRSFWTASTISHFGGLIQMVGASWMMVELTPSPALVTLVHSSSTLPFMLLALPAGAIADSFDRRMIMIAAQSFMLTVSVALAAAAASGWLTPGLLLAFTFAIACGNVFHAPAWHASVGGMVPKTILPAAVAYNSMGFNVARLAGPAVGGVLVAAAGPTAAFLVNALSYTYLIRVLARWKPAMVPAAKARQPLFSAMADGLAFVARTPDLRTVLARAFLIAIACAAIPASLPLVANDLLGGGPMIFGALLGAFGLGAVSGALLVRHLRAYLRSEGLVRCGAVALASAAGLLAASGSMVLSGLAIVVAGAGWVVSLSTLNVSVQFLAERWVLARCLAIYQMTSFGTMAVGSWFTGQIAERSGVRVALAVAAVMLVCAALAGFVQRLPDLHAENME